MVILIIGKQSYYIRFYLVAKGKSLIIVFVIKLVNSGFGFHGREMLNHVIT